MIGERHRSGEVFQNMRAPSLLRLAFAITGVPNESSGPVVQILRPEYYVLTIQQFGAAKPFPGSQSVRTLVLRAGQ